MSLHIHYFDAPQTSSALLLSTCSYIYNNINMTMRDHPEPEPEPERAMRIRRRPPAPRLVMLPQPLRPNTKLASSSVSVTAAGGVPALPPLDLTEDNIKLVLADAHAELGQLFDTSVGITGQVELAELDGPFVKISPKGRFWHKRSTVLARIGHYLKHRIPEILEVDIEDVKQLDDSPENF